MQPLRQPPGRLKPWIFVQGGAMRASMRAEIDTRRTSSCSGVKKLASYPRAEDGGFPPSGGLSARWRDLDSLAVDS
jgi:hypothetical protein